MDATSPNCRLCGSVSVFQFTATLRRQYEISYFGCTGCQSLQTQQPSWLDEAYADKRSTDVGRVQRTQLVAMLCSYLLGEVGLTWSDLGLDWGGGEGLFCRMMRDRGFQFLTYDLYADAIYAERYRTTNPHALAPIVITAIEVLEHLPEPLEQLSAMCANGPRFILATTELYSGEGSDWTYLDHFKGEHVFFYSRRAMEWIAERFGYRYFPFPFLHVFVANSVWDRAEHATQAAAMEALWERRETFFADGARSLAAHLSGPDLWRHVGTDFKELQQHGLA